jgi:hypothetical protein
MKDGTARLGGKIKNGTIEMNTYPNGTFDIVVVDEHGDGLIVATGQWQGYNMDYTKAVWDYFLTAENNS